MEPKEPATSGEPDAGGDVSALEGSRGSSPRSPRSLLEAARARPRRTTLFVALAALAVVGLIAVGLAYRPNSVSVAMAGPSSVIFGSDGIPTLVDGQRVYRVGEKAEWQKLNGSFLVAGYVSMFSPSCPPPVVPQPSAEHDLLGYCGAIELAASRSGDLNHTVPVAPISNSLEGWNLGPAVVMRAHTHDPEAARCGASLLARCEAAVVVEAVVWPAVPTEVNGQHVYRGEDWQSFKTLKGSFLLGGLFEESELESPCQTPAASEWKGVLDLFAACPYPQIDGMALAAKSSIDEPNDEIAVARVHVNDPEAAKCPSDYRAQCKAAIVVEAVVWRSSN